MTTDARQDVTSLFEFAREWYLTYDDQQIPKEDWESAKSSFSDEDEWLITNGESSCKGPGLDFLPVLAAISVGKTGLELLNVCRQHNLQPYSMNEFKFSETGKTDEHAVFGHEYKVPLRNFNVCHEIIQAISISDTMTKEFSGDFSFKNRREFRFACLLSKREDFWPVTKVKPVYDNPFEERLESCLSSDIFSFLNNGVDLRNYPDNEILKILERSGNLIAPMQVELGLPNTFFKDLFTLLHTLSECPEYQNLLRLAEAINSIDDPGMIEHVSSMIINNLTCHDFEAGMGGVFAIKTMHETLDQSKFSKIFDSTLLRTCLTSRLCLNVMQITANENLDPDQHEESLTYPVDQLAKMLADFNTLAPEDYREQHFRAMDRLVSKLNTEPNILELDLSSAVKKTVAALEAYRSSTHVDVLGRETNEFKSSAETHVKNFLSHLSRHMDGDYSQLSELNSESRIMLASAGFDIKKIPNLSRHERGQILSDQLGL